MIPIRFNCIVIPGSIQHNGVDFDLFVLKCNRSTRAGHTFRFRAKRMTSMPCFVHQLSSSERVRATVVCHDNYPSTRHIRCHRVDTLLMRKLTFNTETEKKPMKSSKKGKLAKWRLNTCTTCFSLSFFIRTHSRLTQWMPWTKCYPRVGRFEQTMH